MATHRNAQNMAIPLCLPNNCQWSAATGEYIKTGERRSSLYVVDEALQKLRTVRGPVCVVSIAGPYRKGKSYVLSEAFGQSEVFPLGHHFDPETMGIWMWVVPQKIRDSNGQECTVVLLDSEGIDAVRGEGLDDNQIFTLSVLLASVLIYNSAGVPTRHDLNGLDFIVKLSQRIKLRSNNGEGSMRGQREDTEFFHKTFPFFIWLLRDVTQSIPPDCKDIKEYFLTRVFKDQGLSRVDQNQEVAESILRFFPGFLAFKLPPPTVNEEVLKNINRNKSQINPEFLSGIEKFKELLRSILIPKHSFNDGEIVTGEGLAALVQLYVEAINTPGVIPNVQTAWETFVVTKCSEAANAALKAYEAIMTSRLAGQLPCDNEEIRNSHEAALEQGIAQLEAETIGISAVTTEKYLRELTEALDKKLASWQSENERLTRESCTSLLKQLKKEHLDPVLTQLHGEGGAKVMFEDIVAGYNKIEHDYKARATGAKDVCAAVFFEFHPELMKEMQQYLGVLRQLKDFDENLSREIAAKAYQEQERIKLEEEYARLQQENRERQMEMEMLQTKQQEETKRLREQMEAEAKAQRDQMDNMMKASMKQAEEDRRAFMQENQALNQRLVEMQKSNEGMQQMMENLKQQLQQNQSRQQEVKKPGFLDKALQVIPVLAGVATNLPKCSVM
ncbi:guanylate-binding protein 1-like [Orbicella faveolata]|uniref:guanylate-binding protein 1-like n=1 Tax=Orbicella faveolata TaxID=48498 RepID=UPI0009E59AE7|nr:guanylate-binding protein 1-like [Orbicella faveolata]